MIPNPQQMGMLLALYYLGADIQPVPLYYLRYFLYGGEWSNTRQNRLGELVRCGYVLSLTRNADKRHRYLQLSSLGVQFLDNCITPDMRGVIQDSALPQYD